MRREIVAQRIVRLASSLMMSEDVEEMDPKFVETVRALKTSLPRLTSKKNRKLNQYGIGVIKGTNTVEDLVNALMQVASQ